jgi:hypothetical protein
MIAVEFDEMACVVTVHGRPAALRVLAQPWIARHHRPSREVLGRAGMSDAASKAPAPLSARASAAQRKVVATIGYEGATVAGFLDALKAEGVKLLVDVRALASSRRPGFAKTRLAANVNEAGIEYLHLRGLGTPADGRAAARAGHHAEMRRIFLQHLTRPESQFELAELANLVRSGPRVCLLCYEADPAHCHRSLVADAVASLVPIDVHHLQPFVDSE